jgi:hypothetical protein
MITELANGDERTGGKVRKDVCRAGAGRKAWQVESDGVAGVENATIGYNHDGSAGIGLEFVGVGEISGDEMAGAAGAGNGKGNRQGAGTKYWSGDR